MSLQVWLPLNGSLKNLGLDGSATITGTPAWGTNGKIGNNYLSTSNTLTVTSNKLKDSRMISVSFWMYLKDTDVTTDWTKIIQIGDDGSYLRLESCPPTSSSWNYIVAVNNPEQLMDGGLASKTKTYLNKWTHVVYTYDNINTKIAHLYVDGIKVSSSNTIVKTGKFNGKVLIQNTNKFRMNDFRIYNHALSEGEVKELAKGLIAHYRLTGNGNPNLLNNLLKTANNFNCTATQTYDVNNNVFKWLYKAAGSSTTTSNVGFYNFPGFGRTKPDGTVRDGETYTWSFWARSNKNLPTIQIGAEAGGTKSITITSNWQFFSHTWKYATNPNHTSFTWYYTKTQLTADDWIEIKDFKVEEGSVATPFIPPSVTTNTNKINTMGYNSLIEEDCSGLVNKGTKKKIFTYDINSPMNESCYNFTGDNCVMCYRGGMVTDEITLSCWAYMTDWTKVTRLISCTESGGWNLEKNADGLNFALASTANTYTTNTIIPFAKLTSGWHMITVTYDGLCKKAYVDGVLVTTTNLYTTKTPIKYHSSNGIYIGAEPESSQTTGESQYMPAGSKMSDVRIYATALTQDQITELYEKRNRRL